MKRKLIFWTFGGPSPNYHAAVRRLCDQANKLGIFDKILGYTDKDLQKEFPKDFEKHQELMRTSRRGYGYWWWKPFLALKVLEKYANEGDIVFYLDAGCELNGHPLAMKKMQQYINQANEYDCLFFQCNYKEKLYTKMDTLVYFGVENNEEILETFQVESGSWFMKKTPEMLELCKKWGKIHEMNEHHHATDEASILPNKKEFIAHRHDQSILSLLVKTHKYHHVMEKRYFRNLDDPAVKRQPILTLRTRNGKSRLKE